MAFGLFRKKKEMVDLRPRDSDMPVPPKIKERLDAQKSASISETPPVASGTGSNSGGFFGFFGGNSGDSTNTQGGSSSVNPTSNQATSEVKTDFWGNPLGSGSSLSSSVSSPSSGNEKLESSIKDVIYRLSRLSDRLELIEKKVDRIERKIGISSESY